MHDRRGPHRRDRHQGPLVPEAPRPRYRPPTDLPDHSARAARHAAQGRSERPSRNGDAPALVRNPRLQVRHVTLRCDANPADVLRGSLATPKVRHHAAVVDSAEVGALTRAIEDYPGPRETWIAVRMAAHVFSPPGELRHAQWSEILFDAALWRIPPEKMKKKQAYAMPLSTQVMAMLPQLRSFGNPGDYLFPSIRSPKRPMSDGTLNTALRRIGYGNDEMTAHGFRAVASTLLNESGLWHPEAIERALAHKDSNRVRAAYHRGARWDERVRMMQWWSDQLDLYRSGAEVISIASEEQRRSPPGANVADQSANSRVRGAPDELHGAGRVRNLRKRSPG